MSEHKPIGTRRMLQIEMIKKSFFQAMSEYSTNPRNKKLYRRSKDAWDLYWRCTLFNQL